MKNMSLPARLLNPLACSRGCENVGVCVQMLLRSMSVQMHWMEDVFGRSAGGGAVLLGPRRPRALLPVEFKNDGVRALRLAHGSCSVLSQASGPCWCLTENRRPQFVL